MADYDVIIVGSGLAGLTAGLFAARHGLSTLVLESNIPGGHLISIEKIEDFPGFPDGIAGYDLCPTCNAKLRTKAPNFSAPKSQSLEAQDRLVVRRHSTKSDIAPKPSSSPPARCSKIWAFPAKRN